MAYATPAELKLRMDVNIIRELSDDNNAGVPISDVIDEALTSGSNYADNMIPNHLATIPLQKEVCLVKAQEVLYRRRGYFEAANELASTITSIIEAANKRMVQNAKPVLDSTNRTHTTESLHGTDWENYFRGTDEIW